MTRLLGTVALLLAAAPVRSQAQVTRLADLAFGTVISGTTTSVAPTDAAAASWRIHYTLLAVASSFQLTLPTELTKSGGGATMTVTFCSTCGKYRFNNTNPAGGTTFNPANSVSLGLLALGTNLYVWLGGSVSPPLAQTAGSYSATVVLTLYGVVL